MDRLDRSQPGCVSQHTAPNRPALNRTVGNLRAETQRAGSDLALLTGFEFKGHCHCTVVEIICKNCR